ncbi:hypothetical protein Y032_0020g80 [Ancylostoma ceylanicum]|uniref:Uncharacterized protein n=1 Tax=Ancylostoma ceylanicum TaxID=53326 RepID=A0A016V3E5_9BILA|nr:hypothetical protein Y032_0020g80 [Ancylostoma ceylanicum]
MECVPENFTLREILQLIYAKKCDICVKFCTVGQGFARIRTPNAYNREHSRWIHRTLLLFQPVPAPGLALIIANVPFVHRYNSMEVGESIAAGSTASWSLRMLLSN